VQVIIVIFYKINEQHGDWQMIVVIMTRISNKKVFTKIAVKKPIMFKKHCVHLTTKK
jgi:hypothetical protein